jgi:bifunctional DNA-binding transcriptional regulator/antitoxin component of YhaV-PrlF toxin-antitoxin module
MPHYRTTVGPDGALTLPAALRRKLKINEGCAVEFYLSLDGDVFFHAITGKAKNWKGLFEVDVRSPPISIKEMDQAVGDALAADDRRIRRGASRRRSSQRRTAAE